MATTTAAAPQLDPALYESTAWVAITVVAITLTIATACVALRVYTRVVIIRHFGYDDGAAVLAMVFALASGILIAANTIYGHGRHIQVVDPSLLWKYFRIFYISIVLYNGSLAATKLTFLLQYDRILARAGMQKAIIVTGVVVALWSMSQLLVSIFTCTPIQKFWFHDIPGTCIPQLPFWYINAAGNITTDAAIFLLPLPALSNLKLPKVQKLCLIGVLCLGFFTCAISFIRIEYLKLSTDLTWDNVGASCWSVGELSSGITCACLPTLRPLLAKALPCMLSQPTGGGGGKSSGGYYRHSSGRDGVVSNSSSPLHNGAPDENGRTRGIIYPEDLELQSYDGSDKGTLTTAVAEGAEAATVGQQQQPAAGPSDYQKDGRAMLRPTVQAKVKAGTPGLRPSWPAKDGGIEVRWDLNMTKSPDSRV